MTNQEFLTSKLARNTWMKGCFDLKLLPTCIVYYDRLMLIALVEICVVSTMACLHLF